MAQPFSARVKSSAAGTETGVGLDPTARQTNFMVVLPSTVSVGNIHLQVTLDPWSPTSSQVWADLSTGVISSAYDVPGICFSMLSPVAGMRLASTTWGSTTAIYLKAIQEIIG